MIKSWCIANNCVSESNSGLKSTDPKLQRKVLRKREMRCQKGNVHGNTSLYGENLRYWGRELKKRVLK